MTDKQEIARLKRDIKALKTALGTLLTWVSQSANSPLRRDEVERLLNIMNGHDD